MHTRSPHRGRGFTLVEILVVVIILGIASAMVVPNLGTRNDQNAAAAARVVVSDLMYAQNRAILTQAMRYVSIDAVNQRYAILTTAPNATPLGYEQNPLTQQNYIATFATAAAAGTLQTVYLQTPNINGLTCLAFDMLGQPYACNVSTGVATLLTSAAQIPVRCGTFTLTVYVEPYTGALSVQ